MLSWLLKDDQDAYIRSSRFPPFLFAPLSCPLVHAHASYTDIKRRGKRRGPPSIAFA